MLQALKIVNYFLHVHPSRHSLFIGHIVSGDSYEILNLHWDMMNHSFTVYCSAIVILRHWYNFKIIQYSCKMTNKGYLFSYVVAEYV